MVRTFQIGPQLLLRACMCIVTHDALPFPDRMASTLALQTYLTGDFQSWHLLSMRLPKRPDNHQLNLNPCSPSLAEGCQGGLNLETARLGLASSCFRNQAFHHFDATRLTHQSWPRTSTRQLNGEPAVGVEGWSEN